MTSFDSEMVEDLLLDLPLLSECITELPLFSHACFDTLPMAHLAKSGKQSQVGRKLRSTLMYIHPTRSSLQLITFHSEFTDQSTRPIVFPSPLRPSL